MVYICVHVLHWLVYIWYTIGYVTVVCTYVDTLKINILIFMFHNITTVGFTLELIHFSKAIWIQAHQVLFGMHNFLALCTFCGCCLVLLSWVFLLIAKTSDLSVWLMTILAPLGNFLFSLSLTNNNLRENVSAQLRSTVPSISVSFKLRAYVGFLCTQWYST